MDGETIVAIVAAAIALVAMAVATWQANEARKTRAATDRQAKAAEDALAETRKQTALARDARTNAGLALVATEKAAQAAQDSADEARKANQLTARQQEREAAQQEAAALTEARKIRVQVTGMGGVEIDIVNDSAATVYQVVLNNVTADEHPTWRWQLNPRVMGAREEWDTLGPHRKRTFPVEFADEDNHFHYFAGEVYTVEFEFTDANGQRWRRTGGSDPECIPSDGKDGPNA